MRVTVDVKGEETHEISLADLREESGGDSSADTTEDKEGPTYADLLREIDLSPHEVSVLVDGRPVPEDQPVESEQVTVLRLIKGGSR
ncbi:ubiquitin-like small modifier protein SAMP2 [Natrialba sp. SSL1]|uniref:ubiquitin-like small modifier protein SAMP2 n=1 Tax=Natrialba sp. SSL1 TaxID=1869245 RepID=UPI0008F80DBA|nr:ubiquitin-like small modifier protein 2 [Natrialba sp. SSL1]OIB55510.1 sulfur transfer protein involved in thiamine biosynthesis [Natrialba sp. SSL1]